MCVYNYSKETKIFKESTTNQLKCWAYTYESIVARQFIPAVENRKLSTESQRINNCTSHS